MVEWVKHAETKAAATLASTGVVAGLLYALVSQAKKPGVAFAVVASITAAAVVVAAVSAGIALRPRVSVGPAPVSLLYYRGITHRFPRDTHAYARAFAELIADRPALLTEISGQIWGNATVASRKYRAVNTAIAALMLALVLLAVTAVLRLFAS
ncbi:Pycsar system effector family protein [Verrucosispora sp. TAA-831]|uniref:Pycsar system effector family protein n=1 Tax=Verrucosispora sp. TAA-831 TaxID=3422227 RepID=UPI003D6E3D0E